MAGRALEAFIRLGGFRPALMPDHMRRQLRIIGVSDAQLERAVRRMRTLADWPYVWEAEGDERLAAGEHAAAFAAYYCAQRMLITPSRLKERLYVLARTAYAQRAQPMIEQPEIRNAQGDRIGTIIQLPTSTQRHPSPVVLMLPGVTGTKEELHPYAMPLLRRGFAVARIDHPVYGETDGYVDHTTLTNARHVAQHLAADPRFDPSAIHLHGMSLGALFALHTAAAFEFASVTVICPPFAPGRYADQLPNANLTAIHQMTGLSDRAAVLDFARSLSLVDVAPELRMPLRIFHGGRDRTIPLSDALSLAEEVRGPRALTIYERDHHNCLEHIDEITALTLEFLRNPVAACVHAAPIERRDEAATMPALDTQTTRAATSIRRAALRGAAPIVVRGRRVEAHLSSVARRVLTR